MERSFFNHKIRTKRVGVIVGWVILGTIAAVGFAFLFGYVIMLLWNWLMPEIFGLTEIGYWQAVGVIILAKLLFGFGSHGKHSKSDEDCRPRSKKIKTGFSKWKHYEKFWKDEGKEAFNRYVNNKSEEISSEEISDEDSDDVKA